ncbi:galectin-2 isoform X3 [Strigops habroptila]|uniref:galectin-2 isoform X3 n=1 Tax=Strigops habroptila TaxID=2489341 RepID=UPI0011CEE0A2|nr:galectin-2 isoform X3 [Strigops habroptila]
MGPSVLVPIIALTSPASPGQSSPVHALKICRPAYPVSGLPQCLAEEEFEIFNLGLKTGESLKIKGKISDHTDGFSINLGSRSSDLAFHFNPRFNESVIVCNSRSASTWEAEHRDKHLCFSRGSSIKITIEMLEHKFLVKLPDGHEVEFPNRHCYSQINYMSVKGGFRVTSFKLD